MPIFVRMQELDVKFFLSIIASDVGPKFFNYAFQLRLATLLPSFKIAMKDNRSGAEIQGSELPEQGGLRGFWALILMQFQGAFSDNSLRWLVTFMVMGLGLSIPERDRLVTIR